MTIHLSFEEADQEYIKKRLSTDSILAQAGRRRKAENGGISGPAPLGYVNKRRGYETWGEVDEVNAPFVREAFRLSHQEKLSIREILRRMTTAGMRSRHAKEIGPSALRKILTNPFYAGYVFFDGKLHMGRHVSLTPETSFWEIQTRLTSPRLRQAMENDLCAAEQRF